MEIKFCFELIEIVKMIQKLMEGICSLFLECFFQLKEFFITKQSLTF